MEAPSTIAHRNYAREESETVVGFASLFARAFWIVVPLAALLASRDVVAEFLGGPVVALPIQGAVAALVVPLTWVLAKPLDDLGRAVLWLAVPIGIAFGYTPGYLGIRSADNAIPRNGQGSTKLEQLFDAAIWFSPASCKELPVSGSVRARAICVPPRGADQVTYSLFSTPEALNRRFDSDAASIARGRAQSTSRCNHVFGSRALFRGVWGGVGSRHGRMLCYRGRQSAWMEWTLPGQRVLVKAGRTDGRLDAMLSTWSDGGLNRRVPRRDRSP